MEFQCVICKAIVELDKEQLKTIYELGNGYTDVSGHELGDGYPTVAELCDILSRIKRKTCPLTKKLHVFSITDKERDFMDPLTQDDKDSSVKLHDLIPELTKTKLKILDMEKELDGLKQKVDTLNKTEVELYHKREDNKYKFKERYGHIEIGLWS